jgi:predicted PurR-regulated permease PerM
MLLIVGILVSALAPSVEWLQSKKIPRLLSVTLVFLGLLLMVVIFSVVVFPPLVGQMQQLAVELPVKFKDWLNNYETQNTIILIRDWLVNTGLIDSVGKALEIASNQISNISSVVISQTYGVISGLIGLTVVIVLTFYLLLEDEIVKQFLMAILPSKNQVVTLTILNKASIKAGHWLHGQLIVSTVIGLLSFVGFLILGIKFPLVLAICAGTFSIIPYIGPTLGALPALIVAVTQGPWMVVGVLIVTVAVQQLEGTFITPRIMGKMMGLSPVSIIVSILIGGTLAGIWGVILAIPVAASFSVVMKELNKTK